MNAPCYNCIDRVIVPNCHDVCEKYLKYKQYMKEANEDLRTDSFTRTKASAWTVRLRRIKNK